MVEDAADQKVLLREADLQHHLSNEGDEGAAALRDAKAAKSAEKSASGATPTKSAKKDEAKSKEEGRKDAKEKKEDLQLAAALTFLKTGHAPPVPPPVTHSASAAVND